MLLVGWVAAFVAAAVYAPSEEFWDE
jgi:hypothetical protein